MKTRNHRYQLFYFFWIKQLRTNQEKRLDKYVSIGIYQLMVLLEKLYEAFVGDFINQFLSLPYRYLSRFIIFSMIIIS
ncbi:unknown [Prevotella sp. CAG:924]|nr:unknown [Prevotella sp. CAG:924]